MAVDLLTSPGAGIARRAAAFADAALADTEVQAPAPAERTARAAEWTEPSPPLLDPLLGASVPVGGRYRPAAFLPATGLAPDQQPLTSAELRLLFHENALETQRRDQARREGELADQVADVERREAKIRAWTPLPAWKTWGAPEWALVAGTVTVAAGVVCAFVKWMSSPPPPPRPVWRPRRRSRRYA